MLQTHIVDISWMLYLSDFYVKPILLILEVQKNAIFAILGAMNFVYWEHFRLRKNAKNHENKIQSLKISLNVWFGTSRILKLDFT